MAATDSTAGWRQRPVVTMTALGLVSGALSAGLGMSRTSEIGWLQPLATAVGIAPEPLSVVLVGLCFGLAMGLGIWLSTGRPWAVPVVLAAAMLAWVAAFPLAILLQRTADDTPHLIAASLVAGAVGAGITHLGCALFARELRRPAWIALTCLVGAAAGMLLYASQRKHVDPWLLYAVWQPAVAFSIGLGLQRGHRAAGLVLQEVYGGVLRLSARDSQHAAGAGGPAEQGFGGAHLHGCRCHQADTRFLGSSMEVAESFVALVPCPGTRASGSMVWRARRPPR
jgi:hypothetical protein